MSSVRILVVDDHTLFRKGLISLLCQQEGLDVVGEAKDGDEGVRLAVELRPDMVLMDVKMPNHNGILATQAIREQLPDTRVIMLTMSEEDVDLFAAVKAGANGYLIKSVEPEQLIASIRLLSKGEPVITHAMASKLLGEFRAIATKAEHPVQRSQSTLTARETEILQCIAKGQSNKEIGANLGIAENTVKIHLKNILRKLHMNSRVQAAIYAHQHGLAGPPPDRLRPSA
jgi:two-component system nitrate/nitrite response regulator NarL